MSDTVPLLLTLAVCWLTAGLAFAIACVIKPARWSLPGLRARPRLISAALYLLPPLLAAGILLPAFLQLRTGTPDFLAEVARQTCQEAQTVYAKGGAEALEEIYARAEQRLDTYPKLVRFGADRMANDFVINLIARPDPDRLYACIVLAGDEELQDSSTPYWRMGDAYEQARLAAEARGAVAFYYEVTR